MDPNRVKWLRSEDDEDGAVKPWRPKPVPKLVNLVDDPGPDIFDKIFAQSLTYSKSTLNSLSILIDAYMAANPTAGSTYRIAKYVVKGMAIGMGWVHKRLGFREEEIPEEWIDKAKKQLKKS